jgi:hypothetical protein
MGDNADGGCGCVGCVICLCAIALLVVGTYVLCHRLLAWGLN